jgi:hypothetical protein
MRTTTLTLALLTWWATAAQAAQAPERPNVLVILADDQGYADLGVQGCKDIPTPNIDSLVKQGHYDAKLDADGWHRLVLWMDTYGQRLGSFSPDQERRLRELRQAMATMLVE